MKNPKYERKIYLQDTPREEAVQELLRNFTPERQVEMIPSTEGIRSGYSSTCFCKNVESPLPCFGHGWNRGEGRRNLCGP